MSPRNVQPMTVAGLLALEAGMPRHTGATERVIRTSFGVAMARYYLAVDRMLVDHLELALQIDPTTTKRLLRLREERKGEREAGRGGRSTR